jgi:type II secretory pathway component GspD/PulD (secretin)
MGYVVDALRLHDHGHGHGHDWDDSDVGRFGVLTQFGRAQSYKARPNRDHRETPMKWTPFACIAVMLAGAAPASAQVSESSPASSPDGVLLTDVVVALSKRINKRFVIEPRAQTRLAIGPDATKLSYSDFLDVLQVHGLATVERGDVVIVMPDASVRTMPVPLVSGNDKHPEAEVVTRIIHVRNVPAAQLVPILRPLVPQYGHLAAAVCTNDLLLVDRFANTKRLEAVVQALDTGSPFKPEKCGETPAARN